MSHAPPGLPPTPPLARVAVIGSGTRDLDARARKLGAALATLPHEVHLVTGGGGGAMEGAARGYLEARAGNPAHRGRSIGILPAGPPPGYPNRWIEIPIRTHLPATGERGLEPDSRNHLIILTSDVVVAVPGAAGTRSELLLALRYGRPAVAWLASEGEFPDIPEAVPVVSSLELVLARIPNRSAR